MSKLMRKNIALKQGFFVEARFLYEWKNEARRISASFTLVFKIEQLTQKNQSERWAIDNGTINGNDLGTFFSENILMPHILGLHPREVSYSRIKFRIADQSARPVDNFNYELVAMRGAATMSPQEDPNVITGNYACQFVNENQRSALSLRIKNVVSRPKRDYFIDAFAQKKTLTTEDQQKSKSEEDETTKTTLDIDFILAGLTLNNTYACALYEAFDVIIEKINI